LPSGSRSSSCKGTTAGGGSRGKPGFPRAGMRRSRKPFRAGRLWSSSDLRSHWRGDVLSGAARAGQTDCRGHSNGDPIEQRLRCSPAAATRPAASAPE